VHTTVRSEGRSLVSKVVLFDAYFYINEKIAGVIGKAGTGLILSRLTRPWPFVDHSRVNKALHNTPFCECRA
jgi:hypothetical protein